MQNKNRHQKVKEIWKKTQTLQWRDSNGDIVDWKKVNIILQHHLSPGLCPMVLSYLPLYLKQIQQLECRPSAILLLSRDHLVIQEDGEVRIWNMSDPLGRPWKTMEMSENYAIQYLYDTGLVGNDYECQWQQDISFVGLKDEWTGGWNGEQHQFCSPFYAYKFNRDDVCRKFYLVSVDSQAEGSEQDDHAHEKDKGLKTYPHRQQDSKNDSKNEQDQGKDREDEQKVEERHKEQEQSQQELESIWEQEQNQVEQEQERIWEKNLFEQEQEQDRLEEESAEEQKSEYIYHIYQDQIQEEKEEEEEEGVLMTVRAVPMEKKRDYNVIQLFHFPDRGSSPLRDAEQIATTLHCFPDSHLFKLNSDKIYSLEMRRGAPPAELWRLDLEPYQSINERVPIQLPMPEELKKAVVDTHVRLEMEKAAKWEKRDWCHTPLQKTDLVIHLEVLFDSLVPFSRGGCLSVLDLDTKETFVCEFPDPFEEIYFNGSTVVIRVSQKFLFYK